MRARYKITRYAMAIVMCGALLVGCGTKEQELKTSGLVIDEELSIEATIVKPFDETLYNVAELKTMMDSEAADYNAVVGAGHVTAGDASVQDGIVNAVMTYASAEDYASFNSRYLKIRGLGAAINEGMIGVALKDLKNDSIVNLTSIEDTDGLYLVVTDEVGTVTCPGKVLYISDGVDAKTKNAVTVTDNMDGLAYIIFKLK